MCPEILANWCVQEPQTRKPVGLDQKTTVKTKWLASRGPLYVVKSSRWRWRRGILPCIRRVLDWFDSIRQRSNNCQLGGIHGGIVCQGGIDQHNATAFCSKKMLASPNRAPTEGGATHKPGGYCKQHKPNQK